MFCSSRLERVSHGSDLRLRSQDGKSKKEEAHKLLASQPTYWWPRIQITCTSSPYLEEVKSALSRLVILMAPGAHSVLGFPLKGVQPILDLEVTRNEGRVSMNESLALAGSLHAS